MPLVIVPARLKSARLPDKPLQNIGNDPLIVHCWRRAMEADIGPVYVAADSEAICEVIAKAGGHAVLTGEAHSGTDRVALAAEIVDPAGKHQVVINQQGDMPFINPTHLRQFAAGLKDIVEMATAVCELGLVEVRGQDFFRTTRQVAYRALRFHARRLAQISLPCRRAGARKISGWSSCGRSDRWKLPSLSLRTCRRKSTRRKIWKPPMR